VKMQPEAQFDDAALSALIHAAYVDVKLRQVAD